MENKKIYIASFMGLFVLEAILSMYTGLPYDMKVWFQTGAGMNSGINIYLPNDHLGYPPLWALWCLVSNWTYSFFGNNLEIWRLAIKLPLIFAHLFLAYFVGKFVEKYFGAKKGRRLVSIVLGWFFIFYIGALWGQINTLSALLTFLAFDAMINGERNRSAIFLGLAVTLKIFPLIALPAFLVYAWMKSGKKIAFVFALWVITIPLVFTMFVFAVFQWDILYFLKTIFYWTPIFETSQSQIQGGCMNLWSFLALFRIDVGNLWALRLLWIPIYLGGFGLFWLKKPRWNNMNFNVAIILLYSLFMMSYGWVTEQSFLDFLPFIFLQVLCFRPNRLHFSLLVGLQGLVFAFSATNYGPFIFQPLIERFSPSLLSSLDLFIPVVGSPFWIVRGVLGLTFTLFLGFYLWLIVRESNAEKTRKIVEVQVD